MSVVSLAVLLISYLYFKMNTILKKNKYVYLASKEQVKDAL